MMYTSDAARSTVYVIELSEDHTVYPAVALLNFWTLMFQRQANDFHTVHIIQNLDQALDPSLDLSPPVIVINSEIHIHVFLFTQPHVTHSNLGNFPCG